MPRCRRGGNTTWKTDVERPRGKLTWRQSGRGDALIGTWAKAEAVDAAPAIFSDAGARTWIFLGRFFCARKQAFYGRTKLDFILPVVLLCYPNIPCHEKRYMPYIRKKWY